MARASGQDDSHGGAGDHRARGYAAAATTTRAQAIPHVDANRLDLKALRLALHGWWLGNPLVYKPGVADLLAVARELADAGAASGTLIVSDAVDGSDPHSGAIANTATPEMNATHCELIHAILIVRPPIQPEPLGASAAEVVADVAQAVLAQRCAVRGHWEVVLSPAGRVPSRLCRVSVDGDEHAALVGLRFALGSLERAANNAADAPAATLFARPDWREVFLARVLHALDGRLRALHVA